MPKSQRKKIYRKSNKSLKLKNMKQLRKSKLSKKKTKGGMGCGCQGNNMNNNLNRPISNSIKNRINKGLITNPEEVNSMLKKRYQQNNNLNNSNPTIEEINFTLEKIKEYITKSRY